MLRVILLIAVLMALATPAAAQLPVGAEAPDFTLQDTQGINHTLGNYSDQVVVLFFVGYG